MTEFDRRALPRLLKIADAAEILGVSRFWVYRRIESGEIPVVELGDTRKNQRIRESDLQAFIDSRTYPRRSNESALSPQNRRSASTTHNDRQQESTR